MNAPVLGTPNLNKPFIYLRKTGITLKVLTPKVGPVPQPGTYLSEKLGSVASGWPLRAWYSQV